MHQVGCEGEAVEDQHLYVGEDAQTAEAGEDSAQRSQVESCCWLAQWYFSARV